LIILLVQAQVLKEDLAVVKVLGPSICHIADWFWISFCVFTNLWFTADMAAMSIRWDFWECISIADALFGAVVLHHFWINFVSCTTHTVVTALVVDAAFVV